MHIYSSKDVGLHMAFRYYLVNCPLEIQSPEFLRRQASLMSIIRKDTCFHLSSCFQKCSLLSMDFEKTQRSGETVVAAKGVTLQGTSNCPRTKKLFLVGLSGHILFFSIIYYKYCLALLYFFLVFVVLSSKYHKPDLDFI